MKAFRFTLLALQTLRERAEQQAEEQYARAVRSRDLALRQREEARRQLEAAWAFGRTQLDAGIVQAQWARVQDYCQQAAARLRGCDSALTSAQSAANQRLQHLLEARRDREVVDKYYQKQRRSFDRAQQRAEQKILDDLAGRRAGMGRLPADFRGRSVEEPGQRPII